MLWESGVDPVEPFTERGEARTPASRIPKTGHCLLSSTGGDSPIKTHSARPMTPSLERPNLFPAAVSGPAHLPHEAPAPWALWAETHGSRIRLRPDIAFGAFAMALVSIEGALLTPGGGSSEVAAALALTLFGLTLVHLVDGFSEKSFSTLGEFVRALGGAATTAVGAALLLGSQWPALFPRLSTVEVAAGFAIVGTLMWRSAVALPPGRQPLRCLLMSGGEAGEFAEPLAGAGRPIEILGRIPPTRWIAHALAFHRPQAVLVEEPGAVDVELLRLCSVQGVRVLAPLTPVYGAAFRGPIASLGGRPWLLLRPLPIGRRSARAKRALDLGLILLFSPLLLPLLALVAAAVSATSRGGVLYRQVRVGEGGRPFVLLKFRTMRPDAERETGPVLAAADDPRATSIGRLLRRLHLDELPQLWNVVRGEMSLVGPRPERPELIEEFDAGPEYAQRHLLPPGLTGLAQLVGGYSSPVADKLRGDLVYITSRSLRLDLRLIGGTLLHLLRSLRNG